MKTERCLKSLKISRQKLVEHAFVQKKERERLKIQKETVKDGEGYQRSCEEIPSDGWPWLRGGHCF